MHPDTILLSKDEYEGVVKIRESYLRVGVQVTMTEAWLIWQRRGRPLKGTGGGT